MWVRQLMLFIIFAWWISPPESEAVLDISSLYGWNWVKALLRVIVITYTLFLFLPNIQKFSWAFKGSMKWVWLYILWSGITLILSGNKFYSFYRWIETAFIILVVIILVHRVKDVEQAYSFINDLFLIASLFIIFTLIIAFFLPNWGTKFSGFDPYTGMPKSRLGGYFLRTDIVAGLSLIIFLFYFHELINTAGIKSWLKNIWGIALSSFVLYWSQSRTSLILGISLAGLPIWRTKKHLYTKILWLFLLIAAGVNFRVTIDWLIRRSSMEESMTLNSRIYIWKNLLYEFLNSPFIFTGYGYLTNTSQGLDFYVPEMGRVMNQPHNGYISILLGTGIVGFILALFIVKSWFGLRKKIKSDRRLPIGGVYLASLGALLHTVMDYGIFGVPNPEMLVFMSLFVLIHKIAFLKKQLACYGKRIKEIS